MTTQSAFPGGERTTSSGLVIPATAQGIPDIYGGGTPKDWAYNPPAGYSVQQLQFIANSIKVDSGANYVYFPDEQEGVDPWTFGKIVHLPTGRGAIAVSVSPIVSPIPNVGDPNLQNVNLRALEDQFPPSAGVNSGQQQVAVIPTTMLDGSYTIVTGNARGLLIAVWSTQILFLTTIGVSIQGMDAPGAVSFAYPPFNSAVTGEWATIFGFGPGTVAPVNVSSLADQPAISGTWPVAPLIEFSVDNPEILQQAQWGTIAPAHAAQNTAGAPAVLEVSTAFPAPTIPAGALVVVGTLQRTNAGVAAPVDSQGNTYQQIGATVHPGGATNSQALWYSVLTKPLGSLDTITYTPNALAIDASAIAIFQQWNTGTPADVSAQASGTGTAPSSGATALTNAPDESAVGFICSFAPVDDIPVALPAGWTNQNLLTWEDTANSVWLNLFLNIADLLIEQHVTAAMTLTSGANGWGANAATFKVTYPVIYIAGRVFL